MRILFFGDSIAQGFWSVEGGWVELLRQHFDNQVITGTDKDAPTSFNLGISGEMTSGLLERFENEIVARKYPGEEFVIVIATGTNDTVYRGEVHDSDPSIYAQQLGELLGTAQKYADRILLISLFPVVDELLQPMPWSTSGKCYSTERMQLFNDVLVGFCQKHQRPLVDVWTPFEQTEELRSILFDGVHPNDAGHQIIYHLVKPELKKLIR